MFSCVTKNKGVNFVRHFFGWPCFLCGAMFLSSNEIPVIGAIAFMMLGFLITPLYTDVLSGKKRFIAGVICFFLIGFSAPKQSSNTTRDTKTQNISQIEVKEVKPVYDPKVLDIIPTQKGKGYDKTIKKYGVAGIKKINELLPKAADLMVQNKKCDKLIYVAISDNRSTKNGYTIFGDCANGSRMYVTEQEIKNNKFSLTSKEKLSALKTAFEDKCEEIVLSKLNHPSTYKLGMRYGEVNDYSIFVYIDFRAKNSFNMELRYQAICVFNDKPELVDFAMREKR